MLTRVAAKTGSPERREKTGTRKKKDTQFKALPRIRDLSLSSSVVSVEGSYLAVLYPHLWRTLLTASAKTDGQMDRRTDGQTDRRIDGQTGRRQTLPWPSLSLSVTETCKRLLTGLCGNKRPRLRTNWSRGPTRGRGRSQRWRTGVHVRSVGQRLRLPPEMNGLLLLLLQDEPAQVGLDLLQLLFRQRPGLVPLVLRLVLLLQPPLVPLNLCKCAKGNPSPFRPLPRRSGFVATHGGQGGRTGPVLRLDLGRLVGVGGLSRWELGRLNDSFHVFVDICRSRRGGISARRTGRNPDQPKEAEQSSPCL